MKIFPELNSIGAAFDGPRIRSRRSPENILMESLTYAYDEPLILESVFAIIDHHRYLIDIKLIYRALNRLIRNRNRRSYQGLIFAYSILSKTNIIDDNYKQKIKSCLSKQKIEYLFPNYRSLSLYANNVAKIDPVIRELGLILPVIKKAPKNKLSLNPVLLRNYNSVMERRICERCYGTTVKIAIKHINSLCKFGLDYKPTVTSSMSFYYCKKCGEVSKKERLRIRRYLGAQKIEYVKYGLKVLKEKARMEDAKISQHLGITPEHLSYIWNGRIPISISFIKQLKSLINSSRCS